MKLFSSAYNILSSRYLQVTILELLFLTFCVLRLPLSAEATQDFINGTIALRGGKGLAGPISLSEQEQAWLNRKLSVRVRIADSPPYQMTSPEPQGISVDYLKSIGKRLGINFVFVTNSSITWENTLNDLSGEHEWFDMVVAIKRTAEREKRIAFTRDYLTSPWIIVNRNDSAFISNIRDLEGKKVAVEKGFVVKDLVEKEFPNIKTVLCTTSLEALQAVASGNSDAYIANLAIASYLIRDKGLTNLKIAAPTPFGSHDQAMGVRKDWSELAGIIDKALIAMSDTEENAIRDRWLSFRYEHGINIKSVLIWLAGLSLFFSFVITVVVVWYRRLKREVDLRVKAENDLKKFADDWLHTFESISDSIALLDENQTIVRCNLATCKMLGLEYYEIVNQPCWKLFNCPEIPGSDCPFIKSKQSLKTETSTIKYNDRWMEVTVDPQLSEHGVIVGAVHIVRDISQRMLSEQELKRNMDRLELLQEVSQYHATTVQELLDFSLEKVIALTESTIGYIYHYSEERHQFVLNSWSKDVMASCSVAEPQSIYHLDKTGLWGEVVRQRCPILVNEYEAPTELKKGYPEGHVPLTRFLSVPVFDADRIVAVVGVANKVLPYDQTDQLQLALMMDGVWKIASRLNLEEQISRAGHEWQKTFDSINDSISLIDDDQRIIRCNMATSRLLGCEFTEIIGQPCWKLFHGSEEPIPDCPMLRAKDSLKSESATVHHGDRWLEVTVDPILSPDGTLISAVHVVRDVTERVNLTNSIQEANELFTLFMKYSPIYTFIKEVSETESRVIQVSDNFLDMVGIKSEDMIGKTMHQLFSKEFADKVTADDMQVVSSKNVHRLEEFLNDGTYITYKFPIKRADGKRILAGYTIDVTEQREMEKKQQKQTAVMRGVLENIGAAVFSVDSQLCYSGFNTAHKNVMKNLYNAEIHLGSPILGYMTHEDSLIAKVNLDRSLSGESFMIEADSGDSSLSRRVFEITHNPIRNINGTVEGVAVFAKDITERKLTEEAFREMQAQLMQNDKLATIGQLAAGVAHEINNPMGFVGSNMATLSKYVEKYNRYIELTEAELRTLTSGDLPETVQSLRKSLKMEYVMRDIAVLVEESNEGIERVKRIVQDLRTFSRADSSGVGAANLNSCLDSTINIVINEIKYFAEICREYGDIPKVNCNAQQINQIFMNLLMNATHAIQAKGEEIGRITIRTWNNQDNVYVSIADTGCGIPPENQKRIFDAFFTTKEIGKGTGLGLSISAGIIRKHGGEISLVSDVGIGSTFTVRLPIQHKSDADGELK